MDAVGAALGMGKISCAGTTCTGTRVLLKGTLKVQATVMLRFLNYYKTMRTACAKNTDATKKTACITAGYKGTIDYAARAVAANAYSTMTKAERNTWDEADGK